METRPPSITLEVEVIPDHGKRPVPLRFRSQAEVRAHIAAIAVNMDMLPEGDMDGLPLASLPQSWLAQPVDCGIADDDDEPTMTFAALVEAVNPMDRSQLRAVIVDAWTESCGAVEQAVGDVRRQMARTAAEIAELDADARADTPSGAVRDDDCDDSGEDVTDGIAEDRDADVAADVLLAAAEMDVDAREPDGLDYKPIHWPIMPCRRCKNAPALEDDVVCAACEAIEDAVPAEIAL